MGVLDSVRNFFNRQDFIGRTDTYLDAAISGMGVYDVIGTYFTEHLRDNTNTRLMRYKTAWAFYRGDQWFRPTNDGERKLVINMIKPIVHKSVDWLFGQGWEIIAPPGNENVVPLLDAVWRLNRKDSLSWEIGQMGSICGDAMIQVTVDDMGRDGLLPLEQQRIVIRNLNPAYVHPVYDPFDPTQMTACLIQFPIRTADLLAVPRASQNQRPMSLYSQYITREEVVEFVNNIEIEGSRRPNFLGEINIVHIRNTPVAGGYFGAGDVDDIIPLNEEYNKVAHDIGQIIDYHAAPTTLIYGARAGALEKGPKKIWSGLPATAKVENLKLEGNLDAAVEHLEFLKLSMHENTNTPEASLGKQQEISNTSNAALETQYMPLIEKTRRKYMSYGEGFRKVNSLILKICDIRFGFNLSSRVGNPSLVYYTDTKFHSPIPTDKEEQLNILKLKLETGLESKIGALRELGVKDVQTKALEIIADKREELAATVENAVAAQTGRIPNVSVFGLGSLAVSTGIGDVFNDQDKALADAQQEQVDAAHEQVQSNLDAQTATAQAQADQAATEAEAQAAQLKKQQEAKPAKTVAA